MNHTEPRAGSDVSNDAVGVPSPQKNSGTIAASPIGGLISGRRSLVRTALVLVLGGALGALLFSQVFPSQDRAEVRLVVGNQSLGAQAVPGYTDATVRLAETYARLVTDEDLTDDNTVRATVIPGNPVIRLQTTAPTESAALANAQAQADALIERVQQVASGNVAQARRAYLRNQAAVVAAQERVTQAADGGELPGRQLARLRAELELSQIEADASAEVLQRRLAANADGSTSVSVVDTPEAVSSTARQWLSGAVAGVGLAAVLLVATALLRSRRRSEES